MSLKDKIVQKVIEYYSNYIALMREDILHTQEVHSYTRLIAAQENLSDRQVELLEIAAWLHDIGCPKSKEIYGNSLPTNQQNVGREVAKEFLEDFTELSQDEKAWLEDVVGTHHRVDSAQSLGFMPLFEADLIANILSGYFSREQAQTLYERNVKTESGKALFKVIFKEIV